VSALPPSRSKRAQVASVLFVPDVALVGRILSPGLEARTGIELIAIRAAAVLKKFEHAVRL